MYWMPASANPRVAPLRWQAWSQRIPSGVRVLYAAAKVEGAKGQVFNIAGGVTWRTTGRAYTKDYYDLLGVPIEEGRFQKHPGWCDWYDTEESQRVLRYQNISYQAYLGQLGDEIKKMMQG